eukprot:761806-Hanusia_phi.AAC.1
MFNVLLHYQSEAQYRVFQGKEQAVKVSFEVKRRGKGREGRARGKGGAGSELEGSWGLTWLAGVYVYSRASAVSCILLFVLRRGRQLASG